MSTRPAVVRPSPLAVTPPRADSQVRADTSAHSARNFLIYLYFAALFLRLLIGGAIYSLEYVDFFAADQWTYDFYGWGLAQAWARSLQNTKWLYAKTGSLGQNGMYYWVASLYSVLGHSVFGATAVQVAIVSFIPVLIYKISYAIYGSTKVARCAGILTAISPSTVIWSCLLLKDPLIIFLVCVTIFCTLKLQKELSFRYILPTALAMILVFPLRGYVFYFLVTSVFATLLMSRFGKNASMGGYFARLGGIAVLLAALFALGFDRIASQQINAGLLDRVQQTRLDLAKSAKSGFEAGTNVSTLSGALAFLPRGITYLLFSPFPWGGGGTRVLLAMPETICWYLAFPLFIIGIVYSVRRHFRDATVVFFFVAQLTCFYGIFIGNVGTVHRQRTQVYVFYLIFTCVGWIYLRRKKKAPGGRISD